MSCVQVLITIYWLGRKSQLDAFYTGPQLNFKAFEGLLGLALSKVRGPPLVFDLPTDFPLPKSHSPFQTQVLDEGTTSYVKDGWYLERESCGFSRPSSRLGNSVHLRTPPQNAEGAFDCAEPLWDNDGLQLSALFSFDVLAKVLICAASFVKQEKKKHGKQAASVNNSNRGVWINAPSSPK